MYKAKHYVRVGGRLLAKGESIPEELSSEQVEWLMKAGAIEEIAPASVSVVAEKSAMQEEVPEPAEEPKKATRKTATKKTTERRKTK